MNIIDELKWRGLIFQTTDEAKLREYFETSGRTLYCGFDPSAKSLHVGNMVPLLALLRFKKAGHTPMALMGGATGRIGDPSGKDQERQLLDYSIIDNNIDCIRKQVHRLFGDDTPVLNNYDWIKQMNPIDFLRDIGKHFTVNEMMRKESVRQRIVRDEVGISYTEFSYMILQSLDYEHLFRTRDCKLQIGGSDQWGNITAGTELIRKKSSGEAFALTFPLLTTASGAKFGKSEKGAIYLDPTMTSPWEFYQFWINADDRDVERLLKFFTFKTEDEIKALVQRMEEAPHLREAQKALAEEMTIMVHGREELDKILGAVDVLFGGGDIATVDIATLRAAMQSAPSVEYAADALPQLADMLVDLGLIKSKGQAKKDIQAGAVRVNGEQVTDMVHTPQPADFLHGEVLLIRKGKKHYGLVVLK
ncbi:tyrosyl-tRNA synthetase [Desulfobaculum xiamenense]|uniref:Tyrosine--tRNA ligase n=1 Tax=Desulfobaculum xiamenense TaxID=995050 RepID=A0A846QPF3_9BACT|nr:tyrosine--tRNA ligase [Desulfobaculum xiamenense]NJB68193.1 tyrosyl-tRNA synthetase [Desulfobaculum xiamenense]